MSDTVVVVNRRSGGTRAALESLPKLLAQYEIGYSDLFVEKNQIGLCRRVKRAVKSGVKRILVGGGDGTMAAAMQYLANAKTTLGLLPLGTGNSFAQTMQIPIDLEAAIAIIAAGRRARVDLGRVNGTYFANFATVGLAAEIASETPNELKSRFGRVAYAIAALKPMLSHRPFRAKLRWDEHRHVTHTQQIVVASGRYFGDRPITPDASVLDGKLSVFLDEGTSVVDVAKTYGAMAVGLQTNLPGAIAIETKKIDVDARPRQRISVDGDKAGYTPARFRIEPGALRIFVAKDFPNGRA